MTTLQPSPQTTDTPRRHRDPVTMLLAVLLGVVLAIYIITLQLQAGQPQYADFRVFYGSTRLLLRGESIYTPLPRDYLSSGGATGEGDFLRGNLNPPFQTLLLAPLGLLSYNAAYIVWTILSLLAGLIAIRLIGRELGYTRPRYLIGSTLLLLASYGAWHSTASGQFGMVLLLALVLGWTWLRRRADAAAGLVLGLALSLKLFVGVFVLLLAARGRWRAIAWLALCLAACAAVAAVVVGPASYIEYLGILRGVEWTSDGRNASIVGWLQRTASHVPGLDPAAALAGRLAAAGVLAATTYCAWRANASDEGGNAGYVAAVPAMLLASPLGWDYYFPALLLPLIWLWGAVADAGLPRARVALALFWLLTAASPVAKDSTWLLSTLPFLGLVGFWATSLACLARSRPVPVRQTTRRHAPAA